MVEAPFRLPAHPLVVGLTASAVQKAPAVAASGFALHARELKPALKDAAKAAQAAATAGKGKRGAAQLQARADTLDNAAADTQDSLDVADIDKLAESRTVNPYILVAGYLGGCVNNPGVRDSSIMQVLYHDETLSAWLLVALADIEVFSRVEDHSAAFGLRDVLWLKSDARVVRGDTSDSVQRAYLNGPFVRADELSGTIGGGTFARGEGLLRRAVTPGCCGKTR